MKKRLGMITRQVIATFRCKICAIAHCKWSQNICRNISISKTRLFTGGSAPQNGGGTAGLFQNFWNPYYRRSWLFWRWPNANWTPLTGSMEWEDHPHRRFHATPSLRKILSAQFATRWAELLTKVVFPFSKPLQTLFTPGDVSPQPDLPVQQRAPDLRGVQTETRDSILSYLQVVNMTMATPTTNIYINMCPVKIDGNSWKSTAMFDF